MKKRVLDNAISPALARQIHQAFSRLSRRLRVLDLPYNLTNERLSTLAAVRVNEPVSVSALADAEVVSLSTMSRMVTALEADGFVKCRENKLDARKVLISTTAKGKRAYQRATQRCVRQLIGTLNALESEQLAAIGTLLSTLGGPQLSEDAYEVERLCAVAREVERLYAIAPVGLCYLDTQLRFRYINEWLARINGLPVKAHLGKTIDDVIEDVAASIAPQLRRVLQTGEPIIDGEVVAETPAHPGELRHYRHNYYPDKSEDGMVVGVSCVVQDITERI